MPIPLTFQCIYLLRHPSGKVYVGQAKDLADRLRRHRELLARGKHPNRYLQHVYARDGWVFAVEVLEMDLTTEEMTPREQYWIDHHRACDSEYGYNLAKEAEGPPMLGRKHSEESKAKMAANNVGMTGKMHTEDTKNQMSRSNQLRMLEGGVKTLHSLKSRVPKTNARGKKRPWVAERQAKEFIATDPNGVEYSGKNLKEFSLLHGLSPNKMHCLASHSDPRLKSHRGWTCRYVGT